MIKVICFAKSTVATCSLLLIGAVFLRAAFNRSTPKENEIERFVSPRLAALVKQLTANDASGNRAVVDRFIKELQGKGPLIEQTDDDPHSSWVSFLWEGNDETRNIAVLGGPATGEFGAKMIRLANTSLWYRTDRVSNDARFIYRFIVDTPDDLLLPMSPVAEDKYFKEHPLRPDPLNPKLVSANGTRVDLPEAFPQPWLEPVSDAEQTKHGVAPLSEHTITSEVLNQDRQVLIYTPPTYDSKSAPYGLLVLFDGYAFTNRDQIPVPTILDNLIVAKTIPPLVTVFITQTADRNTELNCSEAFADFTAKELVPWVRKNNHVTPEASQTVVGGISLGGLMASYSGYRHPEVFGNVLSLSGSYPWAPGMFEGTLDPNEEPGWLTRQYLTSPQLPVRFYVTVGRFENTFPYGLLGENHRFRDVLQAKGYVVKYSEFTGGHNPISWRGPFVDGLIWLTNNQIRN
ncbi:MAG TPA: alpha/beta hydrolase-fold protein [Pirellulales bacterium]|jgi:enterochelin esterase family protein|nr:alpha/beta hydrolase-fold protein [Pirellulales bacterium]